MNHDFHGVVEAFERIEVSVILDQRDAAGADVAIDHGQRVAAGHAEGSLPASQAQLDTLAQLVRRWTPEHLNQRPLDVTLGDIRLRTRQYFNRLFGAA